MKPPRFLVVLLSLLCAACVTTSPRLLERRSDTAYVYDNRTAGVRLVLPPQWTIRTAPQEFTVPLQLRPDQEQLLEAYSLMENLGLVVVLQYGPLVEIPVLVQRMQSASQEPGATPLSQQVAASIRQQTLRTVSINGHEVAEWIYTAMDGSGDQPVETTVCYYIAKVGANYAYITFAVPAEQYPAVQPTIDAILRSFGTPQFPPS